MDPRHQNLSLRHLQKARLVHLRRRASDVVLHEDPFPAPGKKWGLLA
jgi:hypothetical protein